jgi:hypothetical protein
MQSVFITLVALWALLDIESFMWVTGPKTDIWLVKTVSVLGLCVGITLLASYFYREITRPVLCLTLCTPLGFTFLDVYYYLQGTIKWTYLIDAGLQLIILIGYVIILSRPGTNNFLKKSDRQIQGRS